MDIVYIADPAQKKFYRARVSRAWLIKNDNGCLFSIGLTVDEDLKRSQLNALRSQGKLTEVTHDQWNHSGCQSSCKLRGAAECRW